MSYKTILELTAEEARQCLLSNESYVNFDLPNYFDFKPLLHQISALLEKTPWEEYVGEVQEAEKSVKTWPGYEFGVNHQIIVNKNSNLSWRPLTLTHPVH